MTQGTFAAEDLSRVETGSAMSRVFTMFYSYFNTQANLLGTEFGNVIRESGFKAPGRLFYIYAMGLMIPAVISEAIAQLLRGEAWEDDDDDGYLDNFLSIFFGGQGKFALGFVPFAGPAVQSGINMLNDKWYDDRINVSPAVSMLEAVFRTAILHPYRAFSEDKELNTKGAIRDALTTIGLATGLPLGALGRPAGYLAEVLEGKTEPANAADFIRGLISGRAIR